MKQVKKDMIKEFHIKKLDCDMMGYYKQQGDNITAHHLLIPSNLGGKLERLNTAILFTTPHEYLHLIEAKDEDIFLAITSEMLDLNIKGFLDEENLRYIDDCLCQFEKEHYGDVGAKGTPLIKEKYLLRHKFML